MNDEIKEILESIEEIYYFQPLLNYITNLQEENQKLVKVIDELEKELKLNLSFRVIGVRRLLTLLTELKGGSDD